MKTKTLKLISKALLVIILATSVLTLSSCDMKYDYILRGNMYQDGNYCPYYFIATSNTNTFPIDDVTFNVAYATHTASNSQNPKAMYGKGELEMYFALYICPEEITMEQPTKLERNSFTTEEDFNTIENYTMVAGLNDQEAFAEEYAVRLTSGIISRGKIFNHIESVTIPTQYFDKENGSFNMKFVCFQKRSDGEFRVSTFKIIVFKYIKIDENNIKIGFEEVKWNTTE